MMELDVSPSAIRVLADSTDMPVPRTMTPYKTQAPALVPDRLAQFGRVRL